MGERSPYGEQCTARAKSTSARCQRRVIGGGVCIMHGGKAPQVAAAGEARIIELQAQLEAGQLEPAKPRHAAEVLLGSIEASDNVMRQLQHDLIRGELTVALSTAYGAWVDRAGRLAKLALDPHIDGRMLALEEARVTRSAEELAGQLLGALSLTLRLAEVSAAARLEVWRSWYRALREIQREQVWPRLYAAEVQAFAAELEEAAAAEEAQPVEIVVDDVEEDDDSELADVAILWPRGPGVA